MQKVLFLTSKFLPEPDANGINTKNIITEIQNRGFEVTCIATRGIDEAPYEIIDGIKIHRVNPSIYSKLMKKQNNSCKKMEWLFHKVIRVTRKIKLLFLLPIFPNFDIYQSYKIYRLLCKLHKKNQFGLVIGVYKPYSNISALIKFKRRNSRAKCGAYYLDLINSMKKPVLMPTSLYNYLCMNADYHVFNELDFSLVAKSGIALHKSSAFESVRSKIEYVEFPTFISSYLHAKKRNKYEDKRDSVVMTYAGTLDKEYRDPTTLLNSLSELCSKDMKVELNVYGNGNCDEIFMRFENSRNLKIIKHGLVCHEVVLQAMLDSDFLINISNKLSNAVPSKIFELFSIGKPIINVSVEESDETNSYFSKYPSVFTIRAWENTFGRNEAFINFVEREKGKIYDTKFIAMQYIENTPAFTADLIMKRYRGY